MEKPAGEWTGKQRQPESKSPDTSTSMQAEEHDLDMVGAKHIHPPAQ